MHTALKQKAIALRKKGLTYSEILKQIPVAKSTISQWLHAVGLAKHQSQRLTAKKILGQQKGAAARKLRRIEEESTIKSQARSEVAKLIKDPLWLLGVVLYWAEGSKQKIWSPSVGVDFTNMDLETHRLFIKWSKQYLDASEDNLKYEIYIHEKADIKKAKEFWSRQLSLPLEEIRVYLKRHNPKPRRGNILENYNGVLKISILKSTNLNRKIAGWTEGVIQYLN